MHLMVMSAINYGVCKALEDEKKKTIESLKLRFQAVVKRLKGEMRADRERLGPLSEHHYQPFVRTPKVIFWVLLNTHSAGVKSMVKPFLFGEREPALHLAPIDALPDPSKTTCECWQR